MLPDDYECEGQMNIEECMQCAGCANEGTEYCTVCEDGDMHMTPDEKGIYGMDVRPAVWGNEWRS